jgi:tetratricopeptide (TPR) repeat protein
VFQCFGNSDASFALLMQISYAIDLTTEERRLHSICYIKMADITVNLKNYKAADRLYHKALEAAWLHDDKENECLIYDKLGITHYLLGEIEKAAFYHDKGIDLVTDKNEQLSKDNCIEAMKSLYVKNNLASSQVSREFLRYFTFTDCFIDAVVKATGLQDKSEKINELDREVTSIPDYTLFEDFREPKLIESLVFHNSQLHLSTLPFITFMKAEAVRKTIKEYLVSRKLTTTITTNFLFNRYKNLVF